MVESRQKLPRRNWLRSSARNANGGDSWFWCLPKQTGRKAEIQMTSLSSPPPPLFSQFSSVLSVTCQILIYLLITLVICQKRRLFVHRIQCPMWMKGACSITFLIIWTCNTDRLEAATHVSKKSPFCTFLCPFFRLIPTPITTIDWILWERYGSTKEKE